MNGRVGIAVMGLVAIVGLCAGCPGELDDPEQYSFTVPCDPKGLIHAYCKGAGCHEPGPGADPRQLDLLSPGVEARLVDRDATYYGVPDTELVYCPDPPEKLIDTADPAKSLFITKLEGKQTCGVRMPFTGRRPLPSQIQCLTDWARGLAGASPSSDAGSAGTGSGGAGSAGAGSGGAAP